MLFQPSTQICWIFLILSSIWIFSSISLSRSLIGGMRISLIIFASFIYYFNLLCANLLRIFSQSVGCSYYVDDIGKLTFTFSHCSHVLLKGFLQSILDNQLYFSMTFGCHLFNFNSNPSRIYFWSIIWWTVTKIYFPSS